MRLTIVTWGTRGDVQPYVALGHELARRGHRVLVAANENHVAWVRRAGLDVAPLPLDTQAALESAEARAWLARGDTGRFMKWLAALEHERRHALADGLVAACDGADAVVSCYLLVHRAAAVAERADRPIVPVYTFPVERTAAYASPYLKNGVPRLPLGLLRRATHDLVARVVERGQRPDLAELRRRLGLPALTSPARAALAARGVRATYVFSPEVLPPPADWPEGTALTGYCRLPAELRARLGEAEPPPGLAAWLAAGPAPVYFGFGSMPVLDPAGMLGTVRAVCRELGTRALVGAGWSRALAAAQGRDASDDVFVAAAFDHDAILPRCRAAVHHGGAGTTGASLAAGLPTVVASVFGDQPLWGHRVAALGVGETFPFQRLDERRLRAALVRVTALAVTDRARALGARLRAEDGVTATADVVLRRAGGAAPAPAPLS